MCQLQSLFIFQFRNNVFWIKVLFMLLLRHLHYLIVIYQNELPEQNFSMVCADSVIRCDKIQRAII